MTLKLSILDQSAAASGRGQDATIRQTLDLAQSAEAWGYHRFWVSEHHSHPSIVGSAPEVLMAAIAARTQRIRLGSAGVMLPHYAALKVAEQFSTRWRQGALIWAWAAHRAATDALRNCSTQTAALRSVSLSRSWNCKPG